MAKRGFNVLFWSTDSHICSVVSSRCFPLRDGAGGGGTLKGGWEGGGPLTDLFPSCQAGVKTSDD